jgi:hypothetical protein
VHLKADVLSIFEDLTQDGNWTFNMLNEVWSELGMLKME